MNVVGMPMTAFQFGEGGGWRCILAVIVVQW